jgi:nicotinamidase/pyrazinamidase
MSRHPVVFLDVDTQRDFLRADGALPVPGGEPLIPIIQKLAAYAFSHGVPVVSSVDAHVPDDPEFRTFPPHCVRGTKGQLKVEGTTLGSALVVPNDRNRPPDEAALEAAPQVVIEKLTYNFFDNPHAETVFRVKAPRLVVVFGVATDYCVRAGVLGLSARGYRTAVVTDAIKGIHAEDAEAALREMRRAGATFITAAEVLSQADPAALTL